MTTLCRVDATDSIHPTVAAVDTAAETDTTVTPSPSAVWGPPDATPETAGEFDGCWE